MAPPKHHKNKYLSFATPATAIEAKATMTSEFLPLLADAVSGLAATFFEYDKWRVKLTPSPGMFKSAWVSILGFAEIVFDPEENDFSFLGEAVDGVTTRLLNRLAEEGQDSRLLVIATSQKLLVEKQQNNPLIADAAHMAEILFSGIQAKYKRLLFIEEIVQDRKSGRVVICLAQRIAGQPDNS